ncbi:hypothetical protein [Thiomicrorhabdus sediminis]|uniref:SLAC1 family transporter n=1 Tax=Thiomicrorhabdus sediminis TaxID=2580412 RepID=UPI00143DC272|nr:hypothetical protein [Thiomicrorhabdus sediminis]
MRNLSSSIFLFGIPLGVLGTSVNAYHFQQLLAVEHDLALGLRWYGWVSLALVSAIYLFGWLRHYENQLIEWKDSAKRSFIAAIMLTLLLFWLSLIEAQVLSSQSELALNLLLMLVVLQFILNIYLLSGWLFNDQLDIKALQPSWFIMLSGNFTASILLSIKTPAQLLWLQELAYLFYAIGCFGWLIIATLLFYRLLFYPRFDANIRPSLFIFLAPISLAAIASLFINHEPQASTQLDETSLNVISWIGLSFASLFLVLWLIQLRQFIVCGISMASWAYVYPLAAFGLLLQYMAQIYESLWLTVLSGLILISLLVLISLLTVWLIKSSWADFYASDQSANR